MGKEITRPSFNTPYEVPHANPKSKLDLPEPSPEMLIRRIRTFLNLVELIFHDLGVSEQVSKLPSTMEFCIASGQRNLEISLAYAQSHDFIIPKKLLLTAKVAVEKHRPVANRFYGTR